MANYARQQIDMKNIRLRRPRQSASYTGLGIEFKAILGHINRYYYLLRGRIPQTRGYLEYRHDFVRKILQNEDMLERFRHNAQLPPGYGYRWMNA